MKTGFNDKFIRFQLHLSAFVLCFRSLCCSLEVKWKITLSIFASEQQCKLRKSWRFILSYCKIQMSKRDFQGMSRSTEGNWLCGFQISRHCVWLCSIIHFHEVSEDLISLYQIHRKGHKALTAVHQKETTKISHLKSTHIWVNRCL